MLHSHRLHRNICIQTVYVAWHTHEVVKKEKYCSVTSLLGHTDQVSWARTTGWFALTERHSIGEKVTASSTTAVRGKTSEDVGVCFQIKELWKKYVPPHQIIEFNLKCAFFLDPLSKWPTEIFDLPYNPTRPYAKYWSRPALLSWWRFPASDIQIEEK